MKKKFHFLGGLPRSGSTVLSAILSQNPDIYVTPTSPLLEILIKNIEAWNSLSTVKANPFPEQLVNLTKGMIDACWEHRPEPIIIDKGRGWAKNLITTNMLFNEEIKMVLTIRDIPSIMASWLTLFKNNPNSYMQELLRSRGQLVTDENIMMEMWFNMVQDCVEGIHWAIRDAPHRLLFVEYNNLIDNPFDNLKRIEDFLQLPSWNYNIEHIENYCNDDDLAAWGVDGMHKIRSKLEKTSKSPKEILGEKLYNHFVNIEEANKWTI